MKSNIKTFLKKRVYDEYICASEMLVQGFSFDADNYISCGNSLIYLAYGWEVTDYTCSRILFPDACNNFRPLIAIKFSQGSDKVFFLSEKNKKRPVSEIIELIKKPDLDKLFKGLDCFDFGDYEEQIKKKINIIKDSYLQL
jgi:hypothetical protein